MTISINLKRLRTRQGHSLERLAKLSGVSRAMLSQIETGKSVPTISLLLKVANALGVPIANLARSRRPHGQPSCFPRRAPRRFCPATDASPRARCFRTKATAAPNSTSCVSRVSIAKWRHRKHAGTKENIVVVEGRIELAVGNEAPVVLPQGDAVLFHADVPHSYRNLDAKEAVLHVVVMYVEPIGKPGPYAFGDD